MKALRIFLAAAAVASLTASCLSDDDPYRAGFVFYKPSSNINAVYANNVADSIVLFSYGSWTATPDASYGGSWCQLAATQGQGYAVCRIPVSFSQNTTGERRTAKFDFADKEHPGDAYASILYWQFATRGDGSLGSAADVKAISGSDGSRFEFSYDSQHRPLSLRITANGQPVRSLTLAYDDRDSTLTVTDGSTTLQGRYGNDYQPQQLTGSSDTIAYASQYYSPGIPISANYVFNLEHRTQSGQNTYYAFLLNGQSLQPDSLHNADSLRVGTVRGTGTTIDKLKLTYSTLDNRHQSADVNQIALGGAQCDPYQLLSLFRYTRSTSILSQADTETGSTKGTIRVSTTLNADKSVSQMDVRSEPAGDGTTGSNLTVYTFEY